MTLSRRPARRLPTTGTQNPREVAEGVNNIFAGRVDWAGEMTLTASTAVTVVTDTRCTTNSAVLFSPMTAHAAAEIGNGTIYIGTYADGSFTVSHANSVQTDRTFRYSVHQ